MIPPTVEPASITPALILSIPPTPPESDLTNSPTTPKQEVRVPAMPRIKFDFIADNKPDRLPSAEHILLRCREATAATRSNLSGIALLDGSKDGTPCAWVKSGSMAEARTQHYVAQIVNGDDSAPVRIPAIYCSFESEGKGYIVMEFIQGQVCTWSKADARLVAAAVTFLIAIKGPTEQPGPIGGGQICNNFFYYRESTVTYSSVDLLESHVNGILRHEGRPQRVRLGPEVQEYGLRLCPSDVNLANFMKDHEGKIVAVDFTYTCFLPISFFELALHHFEPFTQWLRHLVVRPPSTQLEALWVASKCLIPYGTNKLGLPRELRAAPK